MKGIIFVLHGRKKTIASANLKVVEKIASKLTLPYEIGLLEGEFQTLEAAIHSLERKAVTAIVFVPILLFPATHAKEDLPERAEKAIKEKIPYQILPTLGTTKAIKNHLIQAIRQASFPEAEVVLISHGTPHYSEPFQQLTELAKEIQTVLNLPVYPACYHGDHQYSELLKTKEHPLIIQRLFLSEGYLAKKIKQEIIESRNDEDILLPTLQDSDALAAAIIERLEEAECIQS